MVLVRLTMYQVDRRLRVFAAPPSKTSAVYVAPVEAGKWKHLVCNAVPVCRMQYSDSSRGAITFVVVFAAYAVAAAATVRPG